MHRSYLPTLARVVMLLAWLPLAACSSSSSSNSSGNSSLPADVPVTGKISLPEGVAAADYEAFGAAGDEAVEAGTAGEFATKAPGGLVTHLVATPREGSPAATALEGKTAILMTPTLAGKHIGEGYTLTDSGSALLDAKTTLISMLLLNPAIAHHDLRVGEQQVKWLLDKLTAGWPELDAAAAAYEANLAAGTDVANDDNFEVAINTLVNDVLDNMVEVADPTFDGDTGSSQSALTSEPAAMTVGRQRDSTLVPQTGEATTHVVKPGTASGTGVDYYFAVRPVDMGAFGDGPASAAFKSPQTEPWTSTKGVQPISQGVIPAQSYFKVVNLADWMIELAAGALGELVSPADGIRLPRNGQVYEVRFISGALTDSGSLKAECDEAIGSWYPDVLNGILTNLVAGMLEALQGTPGVGEMIAALPEATDIVVEVVKAMGVDAVNLYAAGQLPSVRQLAGLMQKYAQLALNKLISQFTTDAAVAKLKHTGVLKRFAAWMKWGARTTAKMFLSIPGKVANAGCLTHRAYRMLSPKSANEYYLVYPGGEQAQSGCGGGVSAGEDFCDGQNCFNCTDSGNRVQVLDCVATSTSCAIDDSGYCSCE